MLLFISHCHSELPTKCNKHRLEEMCVFEGGKMGGVGWRCIALHTEEHANSAYCPL